MNPIRFMRTFAAGAAVALAALAAAPVHAQSMSNYLENKVVDWLLRGQVFTPPAATYLALFTNACSDAAPGTEPSGGSYARAPLGSTLANWAGTQGAGTAVASTGTSGQTSNNVVVAFPAPTASWGSVSYFGLMDAATAGNLLICQQLASPKTINAGDAAPVFGAGALTITFD